MKKVYFIRFFIITIFICCMFLCGCNKEYPISKKQSLTIFSCDDMELDDDEKNVLNNYMSGIYYEGSNICGFINPDVNSLDIYNAFYCAKIALLTDNRAQFNELQLQLTFLKNCKTEDFSVLNLMYYVGLCDMLSYQYDRTSIIKQFSKYYDDETGLFFFEYKR